MKKNISVALLCLMLLSAAGCGNTERSSSVGNVDIDLTALSSTMVYAEVYNITTKPEDYIGKTIKVNGVYYTVSEGEQVFHYVVIQDTAACCAQGMEFIWSGGGTYPDDYPRPQTPIEMTGVLDSYDEHGDTYYYLAIDDLVF